jgi:hypothetical protein
MRLVKVKWGKFSLEMPGEIFLFVLVKTFLMIQKMNI